MGWFSLGLQRYGKLFPKMKDVIDSMEIKILRPGRGESRIVEED